MPPERQVLIEPLPLPPAYRGGLLGGSSGDTKMSKLAALAAKRRQKENEKVAPVTKPKDSSSQNTYIASLEKLRINASSPKPSKSLEDKRGQANSLEDPAKKPSKRKHDADEEIPRTSPGAPSDEQINADQLPPPAIASIAQPSPFASILTASHSPRSNPSQLPDSLFRSYNSFYDDFNKTNTKTFDFTDPSPDDIVVNAQKSKGSK